MELIDTLAHKESSSARFDVNTAAPFVQLDSSPAGFMYTATGKSVFPSIDNYIILSIAFVLPLGFEIYNSVESVNGNLFQLPAVQRRTKAVGGGFSPIGENLLIPFANYELNLGIFQTGHFGTIGYEMLFNFANDINISMVNVPEDLNEQRFYVPIWIKVLHTLFVEDFPI